ncbi:MAG: phosphoadenylyl-sulfate reductase [Flammeovirgaceae bacterium]|nr:phosphoadenylyl-sulfate reductase [Flammeovirgaceae bacterium]
MTFQDIKSELNHRDALAGLLWISEQIGRDARFSTSMGMEDQLITHWIGRQQMNIDIFTLDTGRLFQETYDLIDLTQKKYNIRIQSYFPNTGAVERLVNEKGTNSFYESVENRKECCHIRKIEPLKRALSNTKVWITGLRADQSKNRSEMELVEWDDQFKIIKYNPLLHWSLEMVEAFIKENNVPVNALHKKGFPSIGCAPCTRAIHPGEDIRAGRWWWEASAKECGLHTDKADSVVR